MAAGTELVKGDAKEVKSDVIKDNTDFNEDDEVAIEGDTDFNVAIEDDSDFSKDEVAKILFW